MSEATPSHRISDNGDKVTIHDLELFVGHINGFDDDESDIKNLDTEAIDSIITKTKRHMSAGSNPKLVLMHQDDGNNAPTEAVGDIVNIHSKPITINCETGESYQGAGIVGDVEMSKSDFQEFLASNKYPRRSAEIWEDGHLSEVALLGRETPARPLRDTKFTRTGAKKVYHRPATFDMVSPGSANTYIPTGSEEKEEYEMTDISMPDHEEDASIKKDLLAKYRMENEELRKELDTLKASMEESDEEKIEMNMGEDEMDEYNCEMQDEDDKMEYEEDEDEDMKSEFSKLRKSKAGQKVVSTYAKVKQERNLYKKKFKNALLATQKAKFNRALDKMAQEGFRVKAHRDTMLQELMDAKDAVAKIKFWRQTMKRVPLGKRLNSKNTRQRTKVSFSQEQKQVASESAVKRIAQEGLDANSFQKIYQEELRKS